MGQIGPSFWMWVTPDTAGVPRCGSGVGDPAGFMAEGARHGLKLAWSTVWEAFVCYSESAPGQYVTEHLFYDQKRCRALPVFRAHADLFRQLREMNRNQPASKTLMQLRAKQKYAEAHDRRRMLDDMGPEVMRQVRKEVDLRHLVPALPQRVKS